MQILIKEENKFMPSTRINIKEDVIEVEERNKLRTLKYEKEKIKEIISFLLDLSKFWKETYVEKKIIDDEIYTITIVSSISKTYYIKNTYPDNWSKFILFRNKLLREEL